MLKVYDSRPAVVVSPSGQARIQGELSNFSLDAELILQERPLGMGDAVLRLIHSQLEPTKHVLLVWGDIPFIQRETVEELVQEHFRRDSDFSMATRIVDEPYTLVIRDAGDHVVSVEETKLTGNSYPSGEREIGLFIFKRDSVIPELSKLAEDSDQSSSSEFGFLPVIGQLASKGLRIVALPIAKKIELISLNFLRDLENID